MRGTLIKAFVVLAIGSAALASPPHAMASALFHCNAIHEGTNCDTDPDGEGYVRGWCDAHCPTWQTANCYVGGAIICYDAAS